MVTRNNAFAYIFAIVTLLPPTHDVNYKILHSQNAVIYMTTTLREILYIYKRGYNITKISVALVSFHIRNSDRH